MESKEERRAFLIDELLGKRRVCPLKIWVEIWMISRGIAGGAILADGKVGLILDVSRHLFHCLKEIGNFDEQKKR